MSEKYIVVHGATCQCKFSVAPQTDELKVLSQKKDYANDKEGTKKLIATDKEIGQTLVKNSFGKCKLQPSGKSFLPCMATITKWSNVYEAVVMSNEGKILKEDSKATCPIGGPDCITIVNHGQKTEGSIQNIKNANTGIHAQLNPLINIEKLIQKQPNNIGIEDAVK